MSNVAKVRELNDAFRSTLMGGRVMITQGVAALSDVDEVLRLVREFDSFSEDNDPYGEHDFGSFEHDGNKVFWKLDYYSLDLLGGSPDPGNPTVTTRVLTVMLAEEY